MGHPSQSLSNLYVSFGHLIWSFTSTNDLLRTSYVPGTEHKVVDKTDCPSLGSLQFRRVMIDIWRNSETMPSVMPDVRIPKREERRPPRQCNSQKGKFIADSSQGSCRIQCRGAGSESTEPKLLHKFIGWAQAIGSWFKRIGYKFAKQFHWSNTLKTFALGLSRGSPPSS